MAGPGHGRIDEARMHRVHADLVGRVLDRGGLGEDAHRALGGVIGGIGVRADDAADRGDIDDRAAAGALHGRDRGLGAEEHAGGVDLHDAVPVLERLIGQPRPGGEAGLDVLLGIAAGDAGDVAEYVEAAVALLGLRHDGRPPRLLADVLEGKRRRAAGVGDLLRYALAQSSVAVRQQHLGAVQREQCVPSPRRCPMPLPSRSQPCRPVAFPAAWLIPPVAVFAVRRLSAKALVAVGGDVGADLAVARHAAGVGHEHARLAGTLAPRYQECFASGSSVALAAVVDLRHPCVHRLGPWPRCVPGRARACARCSR